MLHLLARRVIAHCSSRSSEKEGVISLFKNNAITHEEILNSLMRSITGFFSALFEIGGDVAKIITHITHNVSLPRARNICLAVNQKLLRQPI